MVKWLHVGNPADSNEDGHKIVNAGSPYRRQTQVGGLKPYNMYSFMVREEVGQDNWGKFSAPVDIIMPEDGMFFSWSNLPNLEEFSSGVTPSKAWFLPASSPGQFLLSE